MSARSALCAVLFVTSARLFAEPQSAPTLADVFGELPPASSVFGASAVTLFDRYLQGDHDGTVEALQAYGDLDALLDSVKRDGPAWIAAEGPEEKPRRELAAAVVALEAARAGQWQEWKLFTRVPGSPPTITQHWMAPPLLLEWACELIRQGNQPRPVERTWWLASLAVAERAQDHEFLVGESRPPSRYETDPIHHVQHARARFPDEPRFKLALGIAEERNAPTAARRAFEGLADDVDVRGEAMTRLGVMAAAERQDDRALEYFRQTEFLTRDPWVLYLARFSAGQIFARRNRQADAERAYRRALEAIPHAHSGVVALATLLFRDGRRQEAGHLVDAMLATDPPAVDPWRGYVDADDRFWPRLIAQLRADIRR